MSQTPAGAFALRAVTLVLLFVAPALATAPAPAPSGEIPPAPSATDSADAAPAGSPGSSTGPSPTTAPATSPQDIEAEALVSSIAASSAAEAAGEQSRLSLYGFADFTYAKQLRTPTVNMPDDTFYVGNLNLYADSNLGDLFHSLVEIRFLYLPNGTEKQASPGSSTWVRDTTDTQDYADVNRPISWGGILIERAYVERPIGRFVTARVGQFLTPYGVWNVDHGTPVLIGTRRPYVVGAALFPERQTGIEVYGRIATGASLIGYHLTLSNGRGPTDTYQDLDHNKAVGARVFLQTDALPGTLTLGASAYRGEYTNRNEVRTDSTYATIVYTSQYYELSLGADLKWIWGPLHLQSEIIMNEIAYTDAVRPAATASDGGPPGFSPDYRRWGAYVLGGYRTPFFGVMPYVRADYFRQGQSFSVPASASFAGGLNIRPTARVVLKAQVLRAVFVDPRAPLHPGDGSSLFELQTAWSF